MSNKSQKKLRRFLKTFGIGVSEKDFVKIHNNNEISIAFYDLKGNLKDVKFFTLLELFILACLTRY